MDFSVSFDSGVLTVFTGERIDANNTDDLKRLLEEKTADARLLILDFKNLRYISSAGLRVILSVYREMSTRDGMKIINAESGVLKIFECVGFTDFLNIETEYNYDAL